MTDQTEHRPEEMAAFFDLRAAGYDEHMRGSVFTEETFAQFYTSLSAPIPPTRAPLKILDLGCGTGLELEALFQRVPNAQVTGVDVSSQMLDLLARRYATHMDQITLVVDSYLTMPLGVEAYDHVMSAMSVHHVLHDTKRSLYRTIRTALKPGGTYIEGDSVTTQGLEQAFLDEFHAELRAVPPAADGYYHLDVPFSIETQRTLLLEAGFRDFELVWQRDPTAEWNAAVYMVTD